MVNENVDGATLSKPVDLPGEATVVNGTAIADEDDGGEPQGINTPMTWFAVLAEPVPLCMTRVVIGPTKRELKQKLDGVDAKNVQMIIRGREVMKTMRLCF